MGRRIIPAGSGRWLSRVHRHRNRLVLCRGHRAAQNDCACKHARSEQQNLGLRHGYLLQLVRRLGGEGAIPNTFPPRSAIGWSASCESVIHALSTVGMIRRSNLCGSGRPGLTSAEGALLFSARSGSVVERIPCSACIDALKLGLRQARCVRRLEQRERPAESGRLESGGRIACRIDRASSKACRTVRYPARGSPGHVHGSSSPGRHETRLFDHGSST